MTQPTPSHPDLPLGEVTRAAARSRSQGPWSVEQLRLCWTVLVAVGVVMTLVAAFAVGESALWGVILGMAIVGAFFTASTLVIAWVGARNPGAVLVAALATYAVKVVLLGVVILVLPRSGPISPRWMAIAVVIGLVAWMAAHLRYVWRAKIFYVDPH